METLRQLAQQLATLPPAQRAAVFEGFAPEEGPATAAPEAALHVPLMRADSGGPRMTVRVMRGAL